MPKARVLAGNLDEAELVVTDATNWLVDATNPSCCMCAFNFIFASRAIPFHCRFNSSLARFSLAWNR
jgi:hypothetical protein